VTSIGASAFAFSGLTGARRVLVLHQPDERHDRERRRFHSLRPL
jgi:hypothetical protein